MLWTLDRREGVHDTKEEEEEGACFVGRSNTHFNTNGKKSVAPRQSPPPLSQSEVHGRNYLFSPID